MCFGIINIGMESGDDSDTFCQLATTKAAKISQFVNFFSFLAQKNFIFRDKYQKKIVQFPSAQLKLIYYLGCFCFCFSN